MCRGASPGVLSADLARDHLRLTGRSTVLGDHHHMTDLLYLGIAAAFFIGSAFYVRFCANL